MLGSPSKHWTKCMKMKFKKGQLIYIRFLDHCISDEHELMNCEVVGWVESQTKERLTITYWKTKKYHKDNHEPVNIIKSTILATQVLDLKT